MFQLQIVHDVKAHKDTHLASEQGTFHRFEEISVHLIGSHYHRGNGILVLRSGRGQQRQSSERDVVLAVREAALVIAVRT